MRKLIKRKRLVKRRRIRKRTSKGLKRTIRRIVRSQQETKYKSVQYDLASFNGTISGSADLINPLPQLEKGTGNNERIGNVIQPTKIVVRGYITYYNADLGTTAVGTDADMLGLRLFAFRDKATNSAANAIYNYNLLDAGGDSKAFEGKAIDWCLPHNRKQFHFYADRRMRMLKPYGAVGDGDTAMQAVHNSMFRPFKIVIKPPKKLMYDNVDSQVWPVNFSPRMALGYCHLNNATPDSATTRIAMTFVSTLYYKDA